MLPGGVLCPARVALVPGDKREFWTPLLLATNDHLALGHLHSGSNNDVDLAKSIKKQTKKQKGIPKQSLHH